MKTAPGDGSSPGNVSTGAMPAPLPAAALTAANSARSAGTPATPTPPSSRPFRYSGIPPGFTVASKTPVSCRSALPVVMPSEQPRVSDGSHESPAEPACQLRGRGTAVKSASTVPAEQPRFVFSIP